MITPVITPHPKAPLMSREDGPLILQQIIEEVGSGNYPTSDVFMTIMRQCGFVSLWFFLKFIAGYAQDFDELNYDLHVDMCNFRQTECLKRGARCGMFIPRSHFKTTCVTEGGGAWEFLINPDLLMRITNAIADRAARFMHTIKAIYDSNDLFRALYPEYASNTQRSSTWNDKELVMPAGKGHREPSITAGGVEGAGEGVHVNLHVIDDPLGLKALNAGRVGNAIMYSTRNWFWATEKTLLKAEARDRVLVVGTRYAVDDLYGEILDQAKEIHGYPIDNWEPNEKGRWVVYYRRAVEDGKVIFPENFTMEGYQELAENDWWTWVTQYLNDPRASGLAELSEYRMPGFEMVHDEKDNEWYIIEKGEEGRVIRRALSDFDVVMAIDPAASEKYLNARTSRTAIVVVATDTRDHKYIIGLHADYVNTRVMFDWIFEMAEKFAKHLRATHLETNAGFKLLEPQLRMEQQRRRMWIGLRPDPAVGDKIARIRSILQAPYADGKIHVLEGYRLMVEEEQRAFPQTMKMDILDALSAAVANGMRPLSVEEKIQQEEEEDWWENRRVGATGY